MLIRQLLRSLIIYLLSTHIIIHYRRTHSEFKSILYITSNKKCLVSYCDTQREKAIEDRWNVDQNYRY